MARQERAVRTRHALIRSAAEIFDRRGYDQAKLADISAGADVSPGALHFHFESKAAMARAVEVEAISTLRSAAHIVYRERAFALQALTDMSHVFAHLLRWDVVVRAGFHLNNDSTHSGDRLMGIEWRGCVERLLGDADEAKELASGVELRAAICTVVGITTGLGLLVTGGGEPRARLALTGFWHALLSGLAAPDVLTRLKPAGTGSVVAKAMTVSDGLPKEALTPYTLLVGGASDRRGCSVPMASSMATGASPVTADGQ
ncbi:ScbR family autoregulator-binding transcription factor [Streptomyces sp. NBC_01549]|uniref:ScbR family autoregulator-binding transcription factor n=1 Tax=Streptomyces sp. NBC_01549 TaxID=2975874 RepID=UPI0022505C6E|nr:ScbR family autoregulator-binding transcription factor [Streptomyces sp. NBC_01549]MCX4591801.1 ScbR family autoregulator-binding transcription factor [Streptomyces sp. NBC_01549]